MIGNPNKISSEHLERLALIYVRQSTMSQVREHQESRMRQYGLVEEAERLGWHPRKVQVIDADQGVSGRSAEGRQGFQEVVRRVCLGEVGAIFGLEVSRLARNCADLQRLLEFCALTSTLVVDADGVYDLRNFNDRLLLGLKGTMSEAELHILAGRLQASLWAAARRGELRVTLPVGYAYDSDGETVLDPSEEVRAAVAELFTTFEATGSAYGVVGRFAGRPFPRRVNGGVWAGEVRWGRLSHGRVVQVLSNPAYAGAYVYGRHHAQRSVNPDGGIRVQTHSRPRLEWPVLIQNHHPAYVSWETFLANEQRLAANCTNAGERPPREGPALLQGIIICGACGLAMTVHYHCGKPAYECSHSRSEHLQKPGCRSVLAERIDGAVANRVLSVISPEEIGLALAAADEVQSRNAIRNRSLELRLERARYEAGRAERTYQACEPENRLVGRTLEKRWEEKLQDLAEAEAAWSTAQAETRPLPSQKAMEALVKDFHGLWDAPSTSCKDRKRILRALVADVTVISQPFPATSIRIGVHWRSGLTEELWADRSTPTQRTPKEAVDLIQRSENRPAEEVAAELRAAGLSTGKGRPFDAKAVRWVRHAERLPPPTASLTAGELAVAEVAAQLGASQGTVYGWLRRKLLDARHGEGGRWRVPFTPEIRQTCLLRIARSHHLKQESARETVGGRV